MARTISSSLQPREPQAGAFAAELPNTYGVAEFVRVVKANSARRPTGSWMRPARGTLIAGVGD